MDLISRKAVLDALGEPHPMDYNACSVVRLVKDIPTFDHIDELTCSVCGKHSLLDEYEEEIPSNYCPSCGAKMDLEG